MRTLNPTVKETRTGELTKASVQDNQKFPKHRQNLQHVPRLDGSGNSVADACLE